MSDNIPQVDSQGRLITYPRVGVATIIMKDGAILLGRSNKAATLGKWVVPGGKIEPFEKIIETSAREILEETGIIVKPVNVMFVSEVVEPENYQHRIVIYAYAQYVSGEIKAGGDLSEVRWVNVLQLGEFGNEMTELTKDAMYKFSLVLKSQAMRAGGSVGTTH